MSFRQSKSRQSRRSNAPNLIVIPLLAVACGAGLISQARASILTWNNAAGGSASLSTNWSPAQVPTSVDDLQWNLGAIYGVTFNVSVPSSRTHTYRSGTVTLTMSSPHSISNGLIVGDLNLENSVMSVTTGALTVNGPVTVGNVAGSTGRINVNDDDADLVIGNGADLTVGNGGAGTLSITGTGHVQVADQFIAGANSTSTSTVTVSGFSVAPIGISSLETLSLGQSRIGAGGDATMMIDTGAQAAFAGDLVIANGSASTSTVTVQTAGLLNASLVVDGDLLIGRNSGIAAAGVGTLNVNTGGTASIGADTLLGDPDGGTGTLHLGGGIFNGGTGPISVLAGSTINGFGTLNADINNSGNIQPSGTGLIINGFLTNTTSNQIVGTKINFGPGGGYSGSGTCQAEITGAATSTITATGVLSIGANTTAGFSYNGGMDIGGNIVTLLDSNGAVLGGKTTMGSGRIECPAGIGVQNGGEIEGVGLLVGNLTCSGILDPEVSSDLGGLITVQGNAVMNPTSQLHIRLNDVPASGHNDRVNVSGTASFDGTVHIDVAPGMQLHTGQQFILMNATNGRTGEFASVTPSSYCTGVTFVLVYSSTAAILLVRPPDCDPSHDGLVNVNDLLWVINHWGPCGQVGQPKCEGDIDGISPGGQVSINVNDLLLIINNWGNCP